MLKSRSFDMSEACRDIAHADDVAAGDSGMAFCFLAAFPLGVGLLILGSFVEEGVSC